MNINSDYLSKNTSKAYGASDQIDYYPFGLERSNTAQTSSGPFNSGTNPYLFNGKEIDRMNGLNENDYGGRWYDPAIGGWSSVDPLAEKYYSISPYVYCFDNPVNHIDPDGRDAEVSINKGVMTIKSQIYIYGSGANDKQAQVMQSNIMKNWNNGSSYTDSKTGETYKVNFNVSVQVYNKENPSEGPGLFSNKNNPFSMANFIEVGATPKEVTTSYVSGGDEGLWRGYGTDSAPHEFGHLIGIADQYIKNVGPKEGWSGNIMAEPAGQGKVEQKNIDAFAAPLIEQYHDSKQYYFNQNSTNCSQEFKTKIDDYIPSK